VETRRDEGEGREGRVGIARRRGKVGKKDPIEGGTGEGRARKKTSISQEGEAESLQLRKREGSFQGKKVSVQLKSTVAR